MKALGTAEEQVLFPAVRVAMNGSDVLVASCTTEHRDLSSRLATLALHPASRGFPAALDTLAHDVAHHQRDELESVVPILVEAFGDDGTRDLAIAFNRQVAVD